jgi:hypothetical protein
LPFGRRLSLLGHPIPAGGLGPPHGRLTGQTAPDPDGVTAFRTHKLRPDWVPSLPRGRRCSSRLRTVLSRRLPLHHGQSLHPATTSHPAGLRITRHHRGFKQFTRPIFPSPVAPGWNGNPWAFPRASNPADQEPDDARRGGDRPSSTDPKQRSRHQPNLQSCVFTHMRATSRRNGRGESADRAAARPSGRSGRPRTRGSLICSRIGCTHDIRSEALPKLLKRCERFIHRASSKEKAIVVSTPIETWTTPSLPGRCQGSRIGPCWRWLWVDEQTARRREGRARRARPERRWAV